MKVLFIIKKNFILILFCMFTIPLLATGPSRIISEIKPLSINDKGEILCKTRFSENRMGAHGFQRIEYGLCVITQDTIIQYKTHQFNPEEFSGKQIEELIKYQEYLDSIYTSVPDKHFFNEIKKSISKKYNFVSYNVESYKIDKTYSISEFERYKKVDRSE